MKRELGLSFRVIAPGEEARLAVLGCASLIDPAAEAALIVDIGGGSTELSWVDGRAAARVLNGDLQPPIIAWASAPVGVVSLAEHWPEPDPPGSWFDDMVDAMMQKMSKLFARGSELKPLFAQGKAHIVGTSGTVTSLAGVHLKLPRYKRARVDGVWMQRSECTDAIAKLRAMSHCERTVHPCIGKERADLVLPGARSSKRCCASGPASGCASPIAACARAC